MAGRKVTLTLEGRNNAKSAIKSAGAGFSTMKANIIAANQALQLFAQTAGRAIRFVRDQMIKMVKESAEQERIMANLEQSVVNAGDSYAHLATEVRRTLAHYQEFTRFGDTDIAPVLGELTRATGDTRTAMNLLGITLDFATGTGLDAARAARLVVRAREGDITALARYIPQIQTAARGHLANATTAERAAFAMDLMRERFEGMAGAEGETLSGRLEELANDFGDLREAIGDSIAQSEAFNQFIEDISDFIKDVAVIVAAGGPTMEEAFKALGEIAGNALAIGMLEAIELSFAPLPDFLERFNPILAVVRSAGEDARANIARARQDLEGLAIQAELVITAAERARAAQTAPGEETTGDTSDLDARIAAMNETLDLAAELPVLIGAEVPAAVETAVTANEEMMTSFETARAMAEAFGGAVIEQMGGAANAAKTSADSILKVFGASTAKRAKFRALFEVAEAIAAAARLDFRGAAMHALSAAKFAALSRGAGGAGGAAGGGGGGGFQPQQTDRDRGREQQQVIGLTLVTPNPFGEDEVRRFVYEVNRFGNRDGVSVLPVPTSGPEPVKP